VKNRDTGLTFSRKNTYNFWQKITNVEKVTFKSVELVYKYLGATRFTNYIRIVARLIVTIFGQSFYPKEGIFGTAETKTVYATEQWRGSNYI